MRRTLRVDGPVGRIGGNRDAGMRRGFVPVLAVALAAGLTACAPAMRGATPAPPPSASSAPAAASAAGSAAPASSAPTAGSALPLAFRWVRNSAEHRAAYLEIYRAAATRLDSLAAGRAAGSWGVILDADETVLDNSEYEIQRAALGLGFTEESWGDWVRREAAPALPGARTFLERVHALGGHVVVVTNRQEALCPATRANLAGDGLVVDLVLCRGETSDKNPRFQAVEDGTASPTLPALHVLMWLGDNIQDFPHLSQSIAQQPDDAFRDFGRRYFLLPNPMYGSWQRR